MCREIEAEDDIRESVKKKKIKLTNDLISKETEVLRMHSSSPAVESIFNLTIDIESSNVYSIYHFHFAGNESEISSISTNGRQSPRLDQMQSSSNSQNSEFMSVINRIAQASEMGLSEAIQNRKLDLEERRLALEETKAATERQKASMTEVY